MIGIKIIRAPVQSNYSCTCTFTADAYALRLTVKKQVEMLCLSKGNFERTKFWDCTCDLTITGQSLLMKSSLMEKRFACGIKAAAAYTPKTKTSFFKAGADMNISICIWRLKSALLVKNAWFHNSSIITILTHSNKGPPLQLHQSGVISKRGHADAGPLYSGDVSISLSC